MPSGKMDLETGSLVCEVCCGSVSVNPGAIFEVYESQASSCENEIVGEVERDG